MELTFVSYRLSHRCYYFSRPSSHIEGRKKKITEPSLKDFEKFRLCFHGIPPKKACPPKIMKANKTRLKHITSVNGLTCILLSNTITVWCHGITRKAFRKWFCFIKRTPVLFGSQLHSRTHTPWVLSLRAKVSIHQFTRLSTGYPRLYCRKRFEDLKTAYPRYEKYFAEVQNRQNLKKTGSFEGVLKVVHVKRKLCSINEINNFP